MISKIYVTFGRRSGKSILSEKINELLGNNKIVLMTSNNKSRRDYNASVRN